MAFIGLIEVNIMKLIISITVIFLMTIVVFPSVAESIHMMDKQLAFHENGLFNDYVPKFIRGRISNFTYHQYHYQAPFFTFNCKNVYCILGFRDRPLIHHLTNNEQFAMEYGEIIGVCTGSYIFGFTYPVVWF